MPLLSPWHMLAAAAIAVIALWLIDRALNRRRALQLRRVAQASGLRYSDVDRFNLASRIADSLPDPAAADVLVRDLMYRPSTDGYDYVFTAVYSVGAVTGARRRRIVALAHEPAGRSQQRLPITRIADRHQPLANQYRALLAAD